MNVSKASSSPVWVGIGRSDSFRLSFQVIGGGECTQIDRGPISFGRVHHPGDRFRGFSQRTHQNTGGKGVQRARVPGLGRPAFRLRIAIAFMEDMFEGLSRTMNPLIPVWELSVWLMPLHYSSHQDRCPSG